MIVRLALAVALMLAPLAAVAQSVADAAAEAAADLQAAALQLEEARRGSDRIAALTETIHAYEKGLAAMRSELRRAALREREIQETFERESARLSRLLGALAGMGGAPEATLLLHPSGPTDTVRAGMLLSDLTPALRDEVETLRRQLAELQQLRQLQDSARATLQGGLDGAQEARSALAQAIANRTDLPPPVTTDLAAMQALINSAETLEAFASSLALGEADASATGGFAEARGRLPMPVEGVVVAGFSEPDAGGVQRPGLLIATRPGALVTAPWPASIRYSGPLLDYGQVTILEPEAGYLLILAGLDTAFGEIGEVIPAGAPVGLMGGTPQSAQEILIESGDGSGQDRTETLYMELRQGQTPEDPGVWFDLG